MFITLNDSIETLNLDITVSQLFKENNSTFSFQCLDFNHNGSSSICSVK